MNRALRVLWFLLRHRRFETDLSEELAYHAQMKRRELESTGLNSSEARFAANRALGSVTLAQDQARDVWLPRWLQGLGQDFRLAGRTLRATPIVTTVAVLSLALGIGANTAIFSLVNSLVLRALPVSDPEQLAVLASGTSPAAHTYSYATLDQIRQHSHAFAEALGVAGPSRLTLDSKGDTIDVLWVSGDFFDALDVHPVLGRTVTQADDVPHGGPDGLVGVMSYAFWQRRFAGSLSAVGAPVNIEGLPVTIVGVAPPGFFGIEVGQTLDLYLPVRTEQVIRPAIPYDDDVAWLGIMLRLKPGQSVGAASRALQAVQPLIRTGAAPRHTTTSSITMPEFLKEPLRLDTARRGVSDLRQRFQWPLLALLSLVGVVLLIASANLANLQLMKGAARQSELVLRVALGAGRWQLVRQLLVESILLLCLGGTLGLLMAEWLGRALVAQLSTVETPLFLDLSLDARVIEFTVLSMALTVILFGVIPAWRATRAVPMDALKARGRSASDDRGQSRVADALLAAQVALCLLLVVAAGLLVRTFQGLTHAPLGLDPNRVLNVKVIAPTVSAEHRNQLYHQLVRTATTVPGVVHAAGSRNPPFTMLYAPVSLGIRAVGSSANVDVEANIIDVTPGWFATYGIPLLAGRDVDDRDSKDAQPVMLVNDAFVRRFGSVKTLVGTTLALTVHDATYGDVQWGERKVVGIADDAVYRSIRELHQPAIFYPLAQVDGPLGLYAYFMAVRSADTAPAHLIASVDAALHHVNPDLRLSFELLTTQISESLAQDRVMALLSGFFGTVALFLAALGLYGTTAYAVTRRRPEFGIRMALGATPRTIIHLALSRLWRLVGIGLVVGAAVSLLLARLATKLLYGLSSRDPATLAGALTILIAVSIFSGWLPAWRASRTDPATVLREQ